MFDEKRYILIPFQEVTQSVISDCIQTSVETLRHVRFANDLTDWVVLKYTDKPSELWNEFPVYSDMEMQNILLDDLNTKSFNQLLYGITN